MTPSTARNDDMTSETHETNLFVVSICIDDDDDPLLWLLLLFVALPSVVSSSVGQSRMTSDVFDIFVNRTCNRSCNALAPSLGTPVLAVEHTTSLLLLVLFLIDDTDVDMIVLFRLEEWIVLFSNGWALNQYDVHR